MAWIVEFAAGSMVGSFLNVCIHRLPRDESVVHPRSRCPACRHPIAWYDNIPLVSYAVLGARCRHCREPIHWRYPLVEALTGALTVAILHRFGVTAVGVVYAMFVWALIASSFIDFEHRIIPDEISLGGLAFGLLVSLVVPQLHGTSVPWLAFARSLLGAVVGGGLLYGTGALGTLIFRKEAMGGGDVKLLAMAGSILGWKLAVLTFFLAPLLALLPSLVIMFMTRSHEVPYGPFLAVGLLLSMFYGDYLIRISGLEETVHILWWYIGWGKP